MTFPQKSFFSPDRIKQNTDMMMNSLLVSPSNKSQILDAKKMRSQFKDCFYHSKPIRYLCTSEQCKNKYFTLCDHLECKSMHSHPDINLIEVQKFEQFKFQHLKSVNLLKQRINKYEKQAIQQIIHKMSRDFQMVRNVVDTFYVHKAAKKISQGKLNQLTAKQINQFIQKSVLATQSGSSFSQYDPNNTSQSGKRQQLQSTFIESKALIVNLIQKLEHSISKLTQTQQYKILTLQQVILSGSQMGSLSTNKSLIKKQTFTSKIVTFQGEYQTIVRMLRQNRFMNFQSFKLVYRASQNEFSAEKYHKAVDNKAPILLIVQAQTGNKFGAFLNAKTTQSNDWISDPTGISFIYSLDHNQTFRLKPSANFRTKAIFGGKIGPQIGSGCDLYISDLCHENTQSGANLGGSYQLPFGLEFGTKKAQSYLGGKQKFKINQYQAYLLV